MRVKPGLLNVELSVPSTRNNQEINLLHAQKLVWNALLLHVICTVCICIHFSCVLNGDIMNLSNQSLSAVS